MAVRDAAPAEEVSLAIDRHLADSPFPTLTIPDKTNTVYAVNSGFSLAKSDWLIAGAGMFMILLLTANGIAQSVRERTPEFAVLETLGYPDTGLMALVLARRTERSDRPRRPPSGRGLVRGHFRTRVRRLIPV